MPPSDCCKAGHPYTPENTRTTGEGRQCRLCDKIKAQARRDRLRGDKPKFRKDPALLKTHCFRGHELSGDNVYFYDSPWGQQRRCVECQRFREDERAASGKESLPRKTHCNKGHQLSGDNLFKLPNGYFGCKQCRSDRANEYNKRNRKKINARRTGHNLDQQEQIKDAIAALASDPNMDAETLLSAVKSVISLG